jgi:hypothetical protein
MTRTPKSHHVAELGKRSVKHRRGWSRRKANVSFFAEPSGITLKHIQIINLRKHGNPVFLDIKNRSRYLSYPAIIKNEPRISGKTALWKDIIESGVNVYPRISKHT